MLGSWLISFKAFTPRRAVVRFLELQRIRASKIRITLGSNAISLIGVA